MKTDPLKTNPRMEQAGASDESIQEVHGAMLRDKPEVKNELALMPLFLLGLISTAIFVVSIYLVHNRGGFDSLVYDERFDPVSMGSDSQVEVDPRIAGARHYAQVCQTCHQPTGMGVPGAFPPLVNSERVNGDPERVIRIVLHGLQGPIEGTTYPAVMPAFGLGSPYNWNDQRISEVLTYIRSEWGHEASPITAEEVTAIRTAVGARAQPWTLDELNAQ